MSKYPNAGAGLHKLYVSMIGMIVCVLFNLVPIIGFLGDYGVIVFEIISLVGCYQMAKDIIGCRIAFILQMASIIIGILNIFDILDGFVGLIVNMVNELMPIVIMAFVCFSVAKVMREIGAPNVAKQGIRAWFIYVGCTIVGVVFGGTFILLALNIIGLGGMLLSSILTSVIMFVGFIFIIKFYKNAAEQLGSY